MTDKLNDSGNGSVEFEVPADQADDWSEVGIVAFDAARLPDGHHIGWLDAEPGTYRLERVAEDD